jgi:hypothetical protein
MYKWQEFSRGLQIVQAEKMFARSDGKLTLECHPFIEI